MQTHMFRGFFCMVGIAFLWSGCTNIDCPLDNQSELRMHFYDAATKGEVQLSDSLTIYGLKGTEERPLYNRAISVNTLKIRLDASSDRDTLLFRFIGTDDTATDTLIIDHRRRPHFESLDCPASVFHTLSGISNRSSSGARSTLRLDSVSIANPNVQYEDVDNLKVYLRAAGL